MALRPDEIIESYRVVRHLGGGSSAEVFEVVHLTLGTRHALKVLNRQWREDPELRARFLAEGKLQARFRNQRLVRVTDTIATPEVAALVMDLLHGESLREVLEREGSLDVSTAVRWAKEILEGLSVAHELGVVHRDVKPENLFVEPEEGGRGIRVIDFGIAKGMGGHRTTQRGAMGTCAYMSPEQVRNAAQVDARTDLFAVGTVLWEMLTGRPAFEGESAFASMEAVLNDDPGPPSKLNPKVPRWLDRVVARALSKEVTGRYPTAGAFMDALDAADTGRKPVAKAPKKGAGRPSAGMIVLGLLLGAGSLGAIGLAIIGGFTYYYRPPTLHSLEISSDECGHIRVDLDARARDAEVVIRADGRVLLQDHLQGRRQLHAEGDLPRGNEIEVKATVGGRAWTEPHRVGGEPLAVTFNLPMGARAGSLDTVRAAVVGTCLPKKLHYEGSVAGKPVAGTVKPGEPITLDVSGLSEGRHEMELRIVKDDTLLTMGHTTFFVGERPPENDQDMDGSTSDVDCNDHDPTVGPHREEAAFPNGVDDNCDGRVDEGTIAYDDDGDGLSERDGDCNDADPKIRPGMGELPDCRDQDCDGSIDEGVVLPQREDAYEDNGTREKAFDLETAGNRSFTRDLKLVFSSQADEAWFRFYSDDGNWDDWGIDVDAVELPTESVFVFEVLKSDSTNGGNRVISVEGDSLPVRGRALRNDSGDYYLRVTPHKLLRPWCPAVLRLRSR